MGVWTDYDGDTVYGDYTIDSDHESPPALTPVRIADHMPGSYRTIVTPPVYPATQPSEETNWYHTDQVGSTRAMTGEVPPPLSQAASGSEVPPPSPFQGEGRGEGATASRHDES